MILDRFELRGRYVSLHPLFAPAFEFLASTDILALPSGRHDIVPDRVYVSVDRAEGRGRAGGRLEAHRRCIDIQATFEGHEEIGWRPLAACDGPVEPYDPVRDIAFFDERPDTWLAVPRGCFAIFFPEDAHAPLAGTGAVTKAVVKVMTTG